MKAKFLLRRCAIAKMLAAAVLIIVAVAIAGSAYYLSLPAPEKTPGVQAQKYLCLGEGGETRVFLIDSNIRYDNYSEDVWWEFDGAKKGDPCVIVYGTIRNDYPEDYFISLTVNIYNSTGEKVGKVIHPGGPYVLAPFVVVYAESGGTATFEIPIKYGERDNHMLRCFFSLRTN
jgi:hypothetical protein